jgi:hypothetical protein
LISAWKLRLAAKQGVKKALLRHENSGSGWSMYNPGPVVLRGPVEPETLIPR